MKTFKAGQLAFFILWTSKAQVSEKHKMQLQILSKVLLKEYLGCISGDIQKSFDSLQEAELSTPNFSFYTSVATVFSSKIEGEVIELDSYIKHKREGIAFQPDYTRKIDDLYEAYLFAKNNNLTETNLQEAHKILSKHLVAKPWQGKYRVQNMFVATDDGKIEYVAARPQIVQEEMSRLFADIDLLLHAELYIEEVFYFAAMIHLVFAKIHPFTDGNGRSARLLEKWFMAEKLGEKAWLIQSEKMYYQQHQGYYRNLRALGLEYEELNFGKALPFVSMLPEALNLSK